MAIAYDTISSNTSSANATTLSVNHTASGSDRVAVVIALLMRNATGGISMTSATYGGNAMTERATIERESVAASKTYRIYIYTYDAPPTSSTAVQLNWNTNAIASAIIVLSFTGVDQSDPYDTNATNEISGSSTPVLDFVTGEANTMIVGGLMMRGGDTDPFTPDAADERLEGQTGTDTTGDFGFAIGTIAAATATTYDFGWTAAVSDGGVIAAISLRQASGALNIAPSGLAVGASIGSATVGRGAVAITPSGLAVGVGIGSATVGRGAVNVAPSGLAVGITAGDAVVGVGAVEIAPDGLAVGVAFGTAAVGLIVAPEGLSVAVAIGDAEVGLAIAPSGLAVGVAAGDAVVSVGVVDIAPEGLAVGVAIGDAVVGTGGSVIDPDGLAVGIVIGDATVGRGAVGITPDGLAVGVVIGDAVVSAGGSVIAPTGLAVAIAIGDAVVAAGAVAIAPDGLAVGVVFGTPAVGLAIAPSGLAVGFEAGTAAVGRGAVAIAPEGLAVAAGFGLATVAGEGMGQAITPEGLAVALALGALLVTRRAAVDVPLYVVGRDVRVWTLPAESRVYEVDA